jgi:transposase-like protein
MNIIEYQRNFGTEEECRKYLFERRWSEGFVCPKCGHKEYFNIQSRHLYQCKACNHQASVTAGTIMDKSRTPLTKWFLALYLMSEDKRGISALSLKDKIGVAYQTAWTMCQKIRYAMGKHDEGYKMSGIVEMDEAFFGSPTEGGKRGRGTEKTAVLVGISLSKDGKPCYAKMKVAETVDSEAVKAFAKEAISKGSEIRTDGLNIYTPLAKEGFTLNQKTYDPKKEQEHLHWLHIVISNLKSLIEGTFHGLDSLHLHRYLNEFCYRFNRRCFKTAIFSRLVDVAAKSSKIRYYELIG